MSLLMKPKAQASMEFLMTYGWAILVVVISIGALAYMGVLNPEKFLPEKCIIVTSSGLFCKDYASSSAADTITLRIKNILPEPIDFLSVATDTPACSAATCAADPLGAENETDCILSCPAGLASKDRIKAAITITYKEGAAGLEKTTTGTLQTVVP